MHTFSETGPGVPAFLAKLWRLVEDPATDNLIYWSPDGKSFIIQNQAQFARELLPLNYKHNNMASFIRQLNMYGFHKITSIDNGGLKFDRDDMEFSHPCFQRGLPYLVDNIKRKIAHPKSEEKSSIKPETVNKVLTEVKLMRGRQDTLDNRFMAMKQENEALWREIAVLRQKHMKQQQIVNKLIQFLVTIVQPQRTGLSGMGGKRRFQLMINDTPQSSKMPRTNDETEAGPIIHELGEELFGEVCDSDNELINLSQMGANEIAESRLNDNNSKNLYESMSENQYMMSSDSQDCDDLVINETESISSDTQDQNNVNYLNEYDEDFNVLDETEQILATPLARKEMEKHQKQMQLQQQKQQQQVISERQKKLAQSYRPKATSNKSLLKNNKQTNNNKTMYNNDDNINNNNNNNKVNQSVLVKVEPSPTKRVSTSIFNTNADVNNIKNNASNSDNNVNMIGGVNIKMEKLPMYSNQEDFMNAEMPIDIFEDETILPDNPDSSPMIGGITLEGDGYNQNSPQAGKNKQNSINTIGNKNINNRNMNDSTDVGSTSTLTDSSQQQQNSNKNNWALTHQANKNDELLKLSTPAEYDQHLESFQGELDSLKDLLRGDGVSVDANTLLGDYTGGSMNQNRTSKFMTPSNLDLEQYLKLFADSDLLAPYGLSLSEKNMDENFPTYGSELMTYQPSINCDLSELLDDESITGDRPVNNASQSKASTIGNRMQGLQTPVYDKDFQPFKDFQLLKLSTP